MTNKKNKVMVLMMAVILLGSFTPVLVSAAPSQKVKVIIGFYEKPDIGLVKAFDGVIEGTIDQIHAVVATIPESALKGLQHNPNVRYVEEDKYIQFVQGQTLPWGVDRIDAEWVWSSNTGEGIVIAIVDTGIDYDHPDLDANYVDGYDFVNNDNDPMDDHGHGTHCAGIAAAENNGIGVVGVAPDAKLIAVKALNSGGGGYPSDIADGITWVADYADVISMSFGSPYYSQAIKDACDTAYYSKGCVVVAAAGNSGNPPGRGDNVEYPARYDSVIAVSATGDNDKRARWSSTGPDVELAAPGVDIYSTLWDDTYGYGSGTSMACPHVAGVAALVIKSGITNNVNVRNKMTSTAEDLGDPGRDTHYGYGLVDAEAATSVPLDYDVAVTAINAPSSVFKGDPVTIYVTVENLGTYEETFTLLVTDEPYGQFTATRDITLSAGASSIESFTWDTTGFTIGVHTIKAEAQLEGDEDTSNNVMTTTIEVKEPGSEVIVTAIVPNTMPVGTTVSVTISGSGFNNGADVTLENGAGPTPTVSEIVFVDSDKITAKITARSGGPPRNRVWDVRVTNPDGTTGVLVSGFTVTP